MKKVLITGSAKRLGREIAIFLAKNNYNLLLHYCNSEKDIDETISLCKKENEKITIEKIQFNFENKAQMSKIFKLIEKNTLTFDLLINNASLFEYDNNKTISISNIRKHFESNFFGPIGLINSFNKQKIKNHKNGHIINILDQKIKNLNTDYMSYTLAKLANSSTISYLAQCYAPYLRVNAIAPGLMLVSGEMQEDDFNKAHKIAALGKSNSTEDICKMILYLDEINSITGQTILVDGGQHLIPRGRDVAFKEHE